jgi:hypothetical protein
MVKYEVTTSVAGVGSFKKVFLKKSTVNKFISGSKKLAKKNDTKPAKIKVKILK